jgi:hypothetical protein
LFEWDSNFAGAVHGMQELASVVFDTTSAQPLELPALFRPGVDVAALLSRIAIADLIRQKQQNRILRDVDHRSIEGGAGPALQNFRVFTLTDDELVLHFETYQVGSYTEGSWRVAIPWKTLEGQLAAK